MTEQGNSPLITSAAHAGHNWRKYVRFLSGCVRLQRHVEAHATEPIRVEDVLRVVPLSRRSLERAFQELLGRSPAQEIRRVRLERAKQLLATTDLPIPKVARASGFGTGEYLAKIFRQAARMTPLKYRAVTQSRH